LHTQQDHKDIELPFLVEKIIRYLNLELEVSLDRANNLKCLKGFIIDLGEECLQSFSKSLV
jgi:hypothetical protein